MAQSTAGPSNTNQGAVGANQGPSNQQGMVYYPKSDAELENLLNSTLHSLSAAVKPKPLLIKDFLQSSIKCSYSKNH